VVVFYCPGTSQHSIGQYEGLIKKLLLLITTEALILKCVFWCMH